MVTQRNYQVAGACLLLFAAFVMASLLFPAAALPLFLAAGGASIAALWFAWTANPAQQ